MANDKHLAAEPEQRFTSSTPSEHTAHVLSSISARNAAGSAFLRLPSEIRVRIYELVLGERSIHVRPYGGSRWKLCTCPDLAVAEEITRLHQSSRVTCIDACFEPPAHWYCDVLAWFEHDNFKVQLLETCRQIHREAALVPFTSNTFDLKDIDNLGRWLPTLLPAQRCAMASLVLHDQGEGWSCSKTIFDDINLRRFYVRYHVHYPVGDMSDPEQTITSLAPKLLQRFASHKAKWSWLRARKARVAVVWSGRHIGQSEHSVWAYHVPEACQPFCKSIGECIQNS